MLNISDCLKFGLLTVAAKGLSEVGDDLGSSPSIGLRLKILTIQ
jgi:hypothetical protein